MTMTVMVVTTTAAQKPYKTHGKNQMIIITDDMPLNIHIYCQYASEWANNLNEKHKTNHASFLFSSLLLLLLLLLFVCCCVLFVQCLHVQYTILITNKCIENYFSVYFLNHFFFAFGLRSSAFLWHYFYANKKNRRKIKQCIKMQLYVFSFFTLGMFDAFFLDSNSGIYDTQNFHTPFLLFAISMCTGQ